MPPEQALGQRELVDVCSDVYSLGAVLYACLTGRPPFQAASSMATVMQLLSREPVSPRTLNPDIDADIETICLKCLEKDPKRRYQSASELAKELDRYLSGVPILARPTSLMERSQKWIRRLPAGVIPGDMRFVTTTSASSGDVAEEILASCEDFRLRRINVKSLDVVAESEPFLFRLNAIDYSQALGRVAAGLADGRVIEFDVETLHVRNEHLGHRLKVTSVLYSDDGSRLWLGSHENRILCWNPQTDKPPKALKQHSDKIRHVAFSSDGSLIASCQTSPLGGKDTICIWSRQTGELIRSLPRPDQQEVGDSWGSYCVEFFEQDQKLVSFGVDRTVRCWNVADGSLLQTATTPHINAILAGTISNDRRQAFSVANDGILGIWDLQSFSLHTMHHNILTGLMAVAIAPTDQYVLVGGVRKNGSNAILRNLENPNSPRTFLGVDREIHAVTFSPDSSYFVCGGSWGDVRAIDSRTQQILWEGSQHINNVQRIAFTPDGTRMVTVGLDHRVILWDPKNGQPILNLPGHTDGVHTAAFSPDGNVLATAGSDGQILLWDGNERGEGRD
jgi:WD40 repeat protein